jgi:ferrous iron transport protein B
MSVLYSQPGDVVPVDEEELSAAVGDRITNSMTLPTAVAFLIFSLLYLPCIATIMAIASELSWKWAVGSAVYNTVVAWLFAWIGYHVTLWLM